MSRYCPAPRFLQHGAQLPDSWWNDLAGTLEKVSAVSADRVGVRQQYMGRAIPEFVGLPAPVVSCWATARADVHRASLTEPLRQVFLQNYRIGERAHVRANNATAMPACRPQLSRSSRPAS